MALAASPTQAQAYIEDSSIHAAGDLTVDARAEHVVDAIVVSGAAALGGGGTTGVGISGAGGYAENRINGVVRAHVDGAGADASVAWPHRATAPRGVNQRSVNPRADGRTNAVSDGFISAAPACSHRVGRLAVSRQTAAGLPANARLVNAST